jgi:hypothetical protein
LDGSASTCVAIATARAERDDYKALIKKGIDPKVERTLQKERLRIQQIEEQNALNRLALRITVYDLFTRWFEMDLINRKDKIEIDRMFKKDVLPIIVAPIVQTKKSLI